MAIIGIGSFVDGMLYPLFTEHDSEIRNAVSSSGALGSKWTVPA
ncbi:hypothetical protein [Amycolatopsis palatopharyngis]|nr:hypothetical protein [Amycolatopsis palatopharyngis]